MKCFHCKRELQEGDRFCPYCGEDQGFDQSLIDAARAGDQDAVADLYSRTYENVYHTVRALIRDEDTVLDLVQDTFVKAFEHLDKLNDPNKFRAWVKRIGHNMAVDYTRRTKPLLFSQMTEEESERVLNFEDQRPENSPELMLDRRETSRLVNEILGCLSEDQRLVVGMYYYERRSIREIARELGVSENTVKSRLFQGRGKIETRVRALEAKGTKLYSLSPTAFLLALLRRAESFPPDMPANRILEQISAELLRDSLGRGIAQASAEEAARAAGHYVAESTGRSAARAAAGTAARATAQAAAGAARAAGAGLAKGVAVKVAALITAAAVTVGGGAYAVHEIRQNRAQEPEPEAVETFAGMPGISLPTESPAPPTESLVLPTETATPTESPAPPEESARSVVERLALNRFLSTFAEWPTFSHFSYSADDGAGEGTEIRSELVDYAFWYTRFHHYASVHPEGEYYSIRLDTVNEVLDRVFGFTLSEADAEDFTRTNRSRAHYADGSFYFPAADGECYNRLNLVREIEARGTDTVSVSFDLFTLDAERYMEQGVIPEAYYSLTTEEALREPDLSRELSGEAVVQAYERDGQTVYRLLAYRIGGEPEPEPLTEPEPAAPADPAEEPLTLDRFETLREGGMSVEYPIFRGKGAWEVSYAVYERALELVTIQYDDISQDALSGEYSCAVTLLNDRVLSLVFYGWSYIEGGAHPWTDLIPMNLDLQTLESFKLSELYRMGTPDFAALCYAKGRFPGEPVTGYSEEFYPEAFAYERDTAHGLQYADDGFLKPEGPVFSGPADHFTGCDHIEVLVPYEDLWDCYMGPYSPEELCANRPEKNGLDPALCEAYLRQLASREEDITWFAVKNGASGVRNVAIGDLTGDGVPELLYVTSQQGAGGAFLWIYRYENGQAVKTGQFTWEPEAGQEILRCVFRRRDDPGLYLLYAGGYGSAWTTKVQRLVPQADGSWSIENYARESSYESGHNPDYFIDGMAYDRDEYCRLLAAFYEGVDQVLLYDLRDGVDGRVLSTVDDAVLLSPDCYAMHYSRAVAWLKAW